MTVFGFAYRDGKPNMTWMRIVRADGKMLPISGAKNDKLARLNERTLEIERTLTDPVALAKPYTLRVALRFNPDYDLNDNMDGRQYECSQFMVRKPAFGEGEGGLLGIADHP